MKRRRRDWANPVTVTRILFNCTSPPSLYCASLYRGYSLETLERHEGAKEGWHFIFLPLSKPQFELPALLIVRQFFSHDRIRKKIAKKMLQQQHTDKRGCKLPYEILRIPYCAK
eukprot:scaffold142715_cov58-Attheya_sp.AAC.2